MKKLTVTEKEIFDLFVNLITIVEDEPNEDELYKRQLNYVKCWLESIGIEVKEK